MGGNWNYREFNGYLIRNGMAQVLSTNTFGAAKWIVSSDATQGTHTTIAAALISASSGDTIFIRPGTYTENLTLKAGVNLTAFDGDAFTPNVTISGKATASFSGSCSISGVRLQTNGDFALVVSGANPTIVNLIECYLNCTNNTGISFTSSNSSAEISIRDCEGDLQTTGIKIFDSSSAGSLYINYSFFFNTGGSSAANTISNGVLDIFSSAFFNPIETAAELPV